MVFEHGGTCHAWKTESAAVFWWRRTLKPIMALRNVWTVLCCCLWGVSWMTILSCNLLKTHDLCLVATDSGSTKAEWQSAQWASISDSDPWIFICVCTCICTSQMSSGAEEWYHMRPFAPSCDEAVQMPVDAVFWPLHVRLFLYMVLTPKTFHLGFVEECCSKYRFPNEIWTPYLCCDLFCNDNFQNYNSKRLESWNLPKGRRNAGAYKPYV